MPAPMTATEFIGDSFFAVPVTVGGVSVMCIFTPIKEALEMLAATGESYEHWEAAFDVDELTSNGLAAPLADGTKITDEQGRVFQVNPIKGSPHFRWCDAMHSMVAMRCKQVTSA